MATNGEVQGHFGARELDTGSEGDGQAAKLTNKALLHDTPKAGHQLCMCNEHRNGGMATGHKILDEMLKSRYRMGTESGCESGMRNGGGMCSGRGSGLFAGICP